MRMFIGYFLMGYLLASLKIEKMTDILRMRRFQTLMTSVRVEIRQNLWQVRFVLLRMLWSANLKARGFLFIYINITASVNKNTCLPILQPAKLSSFKKIILLFKKKHSLTFFFKFRIFFIFDTF